MRIKCARNALDSACEIKYSVKKNEMFSEQVFLIKSPEYAKFAYPGVKIFNYGDYLIRTNFFTSV